ncbi:hypothetical protein HPP92_000454 [Vanilla planifolia]|uniref:Uncharacterized protein n=1 Tax=Vanilla planifolia TaxID=51239 RepID=A0A835RS55_VANPL|nr:hypothetical protein HPP92_000454 [Vanilla planifolia]
MTASHPTKMGPKLCRTFYLSLGAVVKIPSGVEFPGPVDQSENPEDHEETITGGVLGSFYHQMIWDKLAV